MPGTHGPYPPEFRRQIVDLVRSGRSIERPAPKSGTTSSRWTFQTVGVGSLNACHRTGSSPNS